jgi:hypothetical protein
MESGLLLVAEDEELPDFLSSAILTPAAAPAATNAITTHFFEIPLWPGEALEMVTAGRSLPS